MIFHFFFKSRKTLKEILLQSTTYQLKLHLQVLSHEKAINNLVLFICWH